MANVAQLCLDSVEAGKVTFYNKDKGYGFVQADRGGTGVFFHVSKVKPTDIGGLKVGQKCNFRASFKNGSERLVATELELLSEVPSNKNKPVQSKFIGIRIGLVTRFSVEKGFGFIRPDDGGEDVFLHVKVLRQHLIPTEKILHHRVKFKVGPGNTPGKTQVVYIKLI